MSFAPFSVIESRTFSFVVILAVESAFAWFLGEADFLKGREEGFSGRR